MAPKLAERGWTIMAESVVFCGRSLDGQVEVLDESEEILLLALLALSLGVVGAELLNAEITVLDLILLLGQELGDGVIDGFLDANESIKLHLDGKSPDEVAARAELCVAIGELFLLEKRVLLNGRVDEILLRADDFGGLGIVDDDPDHDHHATGVQFLRTPSSWASGCLR